jgi:hypothetical protein
MAIQTPASDGTNTAAYVAWGTLRNAIEGLAQGVHERIDRTAFPGLSGGAQTALLGALRFLGLITVDGTPTSILHELAVPDEATRKKHLEAIIRERYADVFALNLTKTTPALLEEKMGASYGVSGSTRDKAVRLFLAMLDYLEIPISPLFKRGGNGSVAGTPRRRRGPATRTKSAEPEPPAPTIAPAAVTSGTTRVVKLKSGGTLTVSASLDLFALIPSDRKFVFDLIDKLEEYEKGAEA